MKHNLKIPTNFAGNLRIQQPHGQWGHSADRGKSKPNVRCELLSIQQRINSLIVFPRPASNELVFVNFYLVWDHASKWLIPVFDDAADKVAREFPETGKVVLAKVDYDEESSIARRLHITKFPALRMIRYGRPAKRNYNGEKSAEAFVSFIKKELEDPVKEYHDLAELATRKSDKRVVIGENLQFFGGLWLGMQTIHRYFKNVDVSIVKH